MAFVIAAAVGGLVAGGGITAFTSWLTGGSHDTYEKGAEVGEEFTNVVRIDGAEATLVMKQVTKDESHNVVKFPSMPWEGNVIIVVLFAGLIIHLIGACWGFLSGKHHTNQINAHVKTKQELEHSITLGKVKDDLHGKKTKAAHAESRIQKLKEHLAKFKHVGSDDDEELPVPMPAFPRIVRYISENEPRPRTLAIAHDTEEQGPLRTTSLRDYLEK